MQPQKTTCTFLRNRNRVQRYNKKLKNTNYSVKKHKTYGIILLALLLCGAANAKVNHYVGGFAQIGEWSLIPSKSDYSGSLGVAGGLGFQYELQAGKTYSPARFLLDVGVGATGGLTAYIQSSNRTETLFDQTGLNHQPFDYVYEIKDRKDKYTNYAVHVPLLVGIQYRRFYALAGIKVYANIYTQSHSSATLTTYGVDKTIIGETGAHDLRDMPEYQFFTDEKVKSNVKTTLNLDLDASVEIGARLGMINYSVGYDVPKRKMEYRLGVFFDYGLLDVHSKGTKPALKLPPRYEIDPLSPNYVYKSRSMIDGMEMNDIMSTNGFASAVKNLVVGVKFTVLFQLPEAKQCVLCRDAYVSSVRGRSGGVKYEE